MKTLIICFVAGMTALFMHKVMMAEILLGIAALAVINELHNLREGKKEENRRLQDKLDRLDKKVMRIFREHELADEKIQPEDLEDRPLTYTELAEIRERADHLRRGWV